MFDDNETRFGTSLENVTLETTDKKALKKQKAQLVTSIIALVFNALILLITIYALFLTGTAINVTQNGGTQGWEGLGIGIGLVLLIAISIIFLLVTSIIAIIILPFSIIKAVKKNVTKTCRILNIINSVLGGLVLIANGVFCIMISTLQ